MTKLADSSQIMQQLTGFFNAQVLLTAVQLDLFSLICDKSMTALEIQKALQLHPRATYDFLDALVAMKILNREGNGPAATYSNTHESSTFLERRSDTYIGGVADMANSRLYKNWSRLGNALRTGEPQSDEFRAGESIFDNLYADPNKLVSFLDAMDGLQLGPFTAFAEKFDFSKYQTMADIGGALGLLCRTVAAHHPHLKLTTFDLPPVAPHAQKYVHAARLSDRIEVASGDFFADPLPQTDVITMGSVLHDWSDEDKKRLIQKAHDALPKGGALVAIEALIDDERRENLQAILFSLNMLLELGSASNFTFSDFKGWCTEAGFQSFEKIPLMGPVHAAIAYK